MLWTQFVMISAITGAIGVALGAFGAHGLKSQLTDVDMTIFHTATQYLMIHTLALLAVGLLATKIDTLPLKLAGYAFVVGILLFSGSLYALVLTQYRSLGAITPIGGVSFILGWLLLAYSALQANQGT